MKQKEEKIPARHQKIIEIVNQSGFESIEQLSQTFKVTPQTIRRDINRLSEMGLLKRFHGGAGIMSSAKNISYQARKSLYYEEKARIASMAVDFIPDNASIFINIGTTTEEVARALTRQRKGLKIITNNLNVASILGANSDFEVIIAGGIVRSRDLGITGEATVEFIRQFKVDFGIIGVSGIDKDGSLLDFDYNEVRVAKTIIANSRQTYLITDSSKFGRNAMVRLGDLSEINAIFTDKHPPDEYQELIQESGVRLFVTEDSSSNR